MTVIADLLVAADFGVFLPHRDGMEFRRVHHSLVDQGWSPEAAGQFLHAAIFALDVYQLVEACDCMVWNLNGRVPDEGAVSEAAMAWMLGKPLVAYKNDARTLIQNRDNPLLAGLVDFHLTTSLGEIVPSLNAALASVGDRPPCLVGLLPPSVQKAVAQGRELWIALQSHHAKGQNAVIAEVVSQLFATEDRISGLPASGPKNSR
jgi:hypothetical protein